jgi:hypothetical protein
MNKKAFLFTISVIIFASTLIIMAQLYSNYNLNYERTVLESYKTTLMPYVADDVAFDIGRLLDLSLDINKGSTDVNITLGGSLSKQFNFEQKLIDYNNFLQTKYFPNVVGSQSINFNMGDGVLELLFGSDYEYKYDFDNNNLEFISNGDVLSSIDLNLDLVSTDLNNIMQPSTSGSSKINIIYNDDQNYFAASYDFNPTLNNKLIFVYNNDYNLEIEFGNVTNDNSIKIDSGASSKLTYLMKLNYVFDSNTFQVKYNTVLSQSTESTNSNSFLKILN